jgi:hypothetical protein
MVVIAAITLQTHRSSQQVTYTAKTLADDNGYTCEFVFRGSFSPELDRG